ncbi:hypothetical protein ER70_10610 (plasmid) [Borreliella bissettiae]|uniref:Bbs27 protein n=1 Tax=Borrelia bissettiae TaxID=64897 RepID=A0A1L8Z8Q0_BORBI|nr:hypothetical protein [Borreliella bissettiae]OJH14122.1 hypothetical protein ER70_10610 [Borreliella bissettiae]
MQKINLLILFMLIISISNLISYEIKKDEIIKVKTLIIGFKGPSEPYFNFPIKKEDKNKSLFEIIGIGLENFINQIGAENILEVKSLSHLMGFSFVVVYKEKKK